MLNLSNLCKPNTVTLKYGKVQPVIIDWKDAEGKTIVQLVEEYEDELGVESSSITTVTGKNYNDNMPVIVYYEDEVVKGATYYLFVSLDDKG